MKRLFILLLLLGGESLCSYDVSASGSASLQPKQASPQEVLREINNQKQSVRALQEAQENYATILDSFRKEFKEMTKASKELISYTTLQSDTKTASVEGAIKTLSSDIKQFKTLLDETQAALLQFKDRLAEFERREKSQSKKIAHLETSFGHVMEALSPTPSENNIATGSEQSYQVKSGDTLEKIARRHQLSIKALKEANHLTRDQIRIGQTLIIPHS